MSARSLWLIYSFSLMIVGAIVGTQVGKNYYIKIDFVKGLNPGIKFASIFAMALIGMLFALVIASISFRRLLQYAAKMERIPMDEKIASLIGFFIGLMGSLLVAPLILQLNPGKRFPWASFLLLPVAVVIIYICVYLMKSMKTELKELLMRRRIETKPPAAEETISGLSGVPAMPKIIDTSVIIDGRIYDICKSGFVEGTLIVPEFVISELQRIADAYDERKRIRGKRGLDILNKLKKELKVRVYERDFGASSDDTTDIQLVKLAKTIGATIITNDSNVVRIAKLQGIKTMNVNELAVALKPIVLPGEELTVTIVREGKEAGQGVGHLEDGTMVVVEKGGNKYIGETVEVIVKSVIQVASGKMLFAELKKS